jgi:hypothetical protein
MVMALLKKGWGSVAAAVLAIVWAAPVMAIGPTVLMFYGAPLKAPVLVTGADTALFPDLLKASDVPLLEAQGRPFIAVAMFWGPSSDPAANGTKLADLRPEMAWQHGRFYPATATKPALLLATPFAKGRPHDAPGEGGIYTWGGAVSPNALAILKRLGIAAGPGH